jgi:hypothetical protein
LAAAIVALRLLMLYLLAFLLAWICLALPLQRLLKEWRLAVLLLLEMWAAHW